MLDVSASGLGRRTRRPTVDASLALFVKSPETEHATTTDTKPTVDFAARSNHHIAMFSWIGRHALVTLLLAVLVGLPVARASSRAGMGSASATMDQARCEQAGKAYQKEGNTSDKDMTSSCSIGFGCVMASVVAPDAFLLPVRVASGHAIHWRVVDRVAGLALAPEVGPPIQTI